MEKKEKETVQLPENAFRELKDGEEYTPVMSPQQNYPEVTGWSVTWGILMAMLFSAAAAYLGLKVGQVFEAAIPIAIIAVGLSSASHRSKVLGENVIIQSIGACSGAVVAGAIFTLPAIYILQAKYPEMSASFLKIFISSLLGGVIGILFLIPFRKYFVSDMHGKYPFPEATATTQVLVSGEKGGSQAKPLLLAGLVGGLYDFIVATLGWWNENFTSRVVDFGATIADKLKLVFKVNTGAAVLGLGYIIGFHYSLIITLGSLAVWWLIVPGMAFLFHDHVLSAWDPSITATVGAMSPEQIFTSYGKSIGIGGIAMAGIIGIIKSWGIIKGAVSLAAGEMKGKDDTQKTVKRTQRDISFKVIAIGSAITILITFLFFWFGVMDGNLLFAVVGILLVTVIAFLFTTVAANAIGACIAIVLTLCRIPALPFALGMFIPIQLNIPLLVGGAVNWFVTSRSKDAETNKQRGEKGTLLASGFIAGGALMGVVSALLRFGGVELISDNWLANPLSELCSLVAYVLLIGYFVRATRESK
ncbi:OPT/YSL family transporter [Hoylesella oralis]|uniref:OPT/YSL family transporter n=1 Tax=Hoylesella oralis TaxID=28134 RepID=UPI0028EC5B99|nr:OPT/YSL family transporter [Hoylesella oralis]